MNAKNVLELLSPVKQRGYLLLFVVTAVCLVPFPVIVFREFS